MDCYSSGFKFFTFQKFCFMNQMGILVSGLPPFVKINKGEMMQ